MLLKKYIKRVVNDLLRESPRELAKAQDFSDDECKEAVRKVEIILPLALLLHAFNKAPLEYDSPGLDKWLETLTAFIKREVKNFSYSYWIRNSGSSRKFTLPDDLDDTSFCISALLSAGEKVDERFFLKIISIESKPGGPYWTWYVPKSEKFKKWQDTDPAVNANFVYAASLYGIRLKNTEKYLLEALSEDRLLSRYYPSKLITLFYLARFYHRIRDQQFYIGINRQLKRLKFSKLTKIGKLLYLLTESYLGIKKQSSEILKFKIELLPFCYGFSHGNNEKTFVGSRTITAALLLELLFVQINLRQKPVKLIREKKIPALVNALVKTAKSFMKKEYNFHNVIAVPYYTVLSLKGDLTGGDAEKIRNLSLGLFYSWRGYTILDEIVDGQRELEDHPRADLLIREGKSYFSKIRNEKFHKALVKAFLECDLSFASESLKKKRNSYDYVEKRMMPFLVCMKYLPELLDIGKSKGESLYKVFRAQMIIDQLSDEAHDWREDLKFKRITYATSKLAGVDKKKLNSIFWNKIMHGIIEICTQEYKTALLEIKKMRAKDSFFASIMEKSYSPIRKASETMRSAQKVIQSL